MIKRADGGFINWYRPTPLAVGDPPPARCRPSDPNIPSHAQRGEGLAKAEDGARSGTQNVSVDPCHTDTFFLAATNGLEANLEHENIALDCEQKGSFNAHPDLRRSRLRGGVG